MDLTKSELQRLHYVLNQVNDEHPNEFDRDILNKLDTMMNESVETDYTSEFDKMMGKNEIDTFLNNMMGGKLWKQLKKCLRS